MTIPSKCKANFVDPPSVSDSSFSLSDGSYISSGTGIIRSGLHQVHENFVGVNPLNFVSDGLNNFKRIRVMYPLSSCPSQVPPERLLELTVFGALCSIRMIHGLGAEVEPVFLYWAIHGGNGTFLPDILAQYHPSLSADIARLRTASHTDNLQNLNDFFIQYFDCTVSLQFPVLTLFSPASSGRLVSCPYTRAASQLDQRSDVASPNGIGFTRPSRNPSFRQRCFPSV